MIVVRITLASENHEYDRIVQLCELKRFKNGALSRNQSQYHRLFYSSVAQVHKPHDYEHVY